MLLIESDIEPCVEGVPLVLVPVRRELVNLAKSRVGPPPARHLRDDVCVIGASFDSTGVATQVADPDGAFHGA